MRSPKRTVHFNMPMTNLDDLTLTFAAFPRTHREEWKSTEVTIGSVENYCQHCLCFVV